MVRPLALASLIAFAVLPVLPGAAGPARADGVDTPVSRHRPWHPRRAQRVHPPRWRTAAPAYAPAPALAYGWLPRNLNLPIYNAPSEGPAPQL